MSIARRLSRSHFKLLAGLSLLIGILCNNFGVSSSAESKLPANASAHNQKAIGAGSPLNSLDTYQGGTSPTLSGTNRTTAPVPSNPVCNPQNDACIWEDDRTPGALGCRIPLLFIHGIHGNEITSDDSSCYNAAIQKGLVKKGKTIDDPYRAPNKCYFNSLITQVVSSSKASIAANYKIYRFHYKSDVNSVQTIGLDLRMLLDKLIDNDPNFDKEFIIVAHSMGGLVARAYMNLYRHHSGAGDSRFKGKLAGDRVRKLITLGTPHHGSQLSNGLARTQNSFLGTPWSAVFRAIDKKVWGSWSCVTYSDECLGKANRADLHWDDYNGMWTKLRSSYRDNPVEQNSLLRSLSSTTYDNKIYPYFGYLGDGKISGRRADVIAFGKSNPVSLASALANNQHFPNQHRGLVAAGVVLERIDQDNFAFNIFSLIPVVGLTNLFNDGFVTIPSASFSGRSDRTKLRTCQGYDHMEMRDGASYNCRAGGVEKPLVQFLIDDLTLDSTAPCPRVVVSTSLRLAQGSGPFGVGQKLDGTFSVTNRGNANLVMKQILIGGRVGDTCPNNVCPDFGPIPRDITLAPGKTYNYSGSFSPQRSGTYDLYVAGQTPDGKWDMPVESENGTTNRLRIVVGNPLPTLTGKSPTVISASPKDQIVFLNGSGLANTLYCLVRFPNGKEIYVYYLPWQIFKRSDGQLQGKFKFTMRGTYQIRAFTQDGVWSNTIPIVVN